MHPVNNFSVIDAHMHFNLNTQDPLLDLIDHMNRNCIQKSLVILNSEKELNYYDYLIQQKKLDNIEKSFEFAFGLNFRDYAQINHIVNELSNFSKGIYKLHPRITDIRKEDFKSVYLLLKKICANVVLIDCFGYGHQLENHIGIELGVYLADKLPGIKFVLCHSGGENILKCILYTRTLPNIYYDISLTCTYLRYSSVHNDIINMLKYNNARVMFGSDYPDFTPQDAIMALEDLCAEAGLKQEKTQNIFFMNAQELYFN